MILNDYLRIPFLHQGRSRAGVDCFGLLLFYYQEERGITLQDFTGYLLDWHFRGEDYFLNRIGAWGFAPVTGHPRPGDVILFNKNHRISHCGVVLDDEYFLHMTQDGAAVHPWRQGFWSTRIHGTFRHQEFLP